jgi:hypothetical protein
LHLSACISRLAPLCLHNSACTTLLTPLCLHTSACTPLCLHLSACTFLLAPLCLHKFACISLCLYLYLNPSLLAPPTCTSSCNTLRLHPMSFECSLEFPFACPIVFTVFAIVTVLSLCSPSLRFLTS